MKAAVGLMEHPSKPKVLLLHSESSGPDKYASILREHGCDVYNVPTLHFVYQNLDSLEKQMNNPAQFSGIIFTSPRAVIATSEATREQINSGWKDKPCFVVGEKTGSLVMEKLGLSHIGSESGDASALANIIVAEMMDKNLPLLFPCGTLKRETLPKKLQDAGIQVHSSTVYATQQHPSLGETLTEYLRLRPDFVVYFSPSGVNFSQEAMKRAEYFQQMKHVSIGPITKDSLEKSGMKVFACATKPCPEAVLEAIKGP